jgi:hypothetical protein
MGDNEWPSLTPNQKANFDLTKAEVIIGIGTAEESQEKKPLKLIIVKEGDSPSVGEIIVKLNGTEVLKTYAAILDICKDFGKIGDDRVVFLREHSGGNICLATTFRFISWKSDGSYSVSEKFGNCNGGKHAPDISQRNTKLTLHFESYVGRISNTEHPSETWVYENGKLKKIE